MAGSGTAHLRPTQDTLLRAEHLVVEFPVGRRGLKVHAVSDVSIDVRTGETLGLVGESGCGKSTTGRALMQLPRPTGGRVVFGERELTSLDADDLRRVRPKMQMIFQDPISSLNPRRRVGEIVAEPLRIWASEFHPPSPRLWLAAQLLRADAVMRTAFVAAFLVLWLLDSVIPALTGFHVEVATGLFQRLQADLGVLFIGAVAFGGVSWGLASAVRDRTRRVRLALAGEAVAAVVAALWQVRGGIDTAAVAYAIGAVLLLAALVPVIVSSGEFRRMAALRADHDQLVRQTMENVGIDPDAAWNRRPHQFSGGQCQRICIARALVLDPQLIICDEPVSALDVSVQAQILNLLEDMKARYGLTLVFIAHDLAVVKNISDRVAVMYLGKLCEVAPSDDLYDRPAHPYTAALLSSIPVPDPALALGANAALAGEIPSPVAPPSGCRFRTRCPRATELCAQDEPQLREIGPDHFVACHFPVGGQEALTPADRGAARV